MPRTGGQKQTTREQDDARPAEQDARDVLLCPLVGAASARLVASRCIEFATKDSCALMAQNRGTAATGDPDVQLCFAFCCGLIAASAR